MTDAGIHAAALDILKDSRDIIQAPERWTQGVDARDSDGHPCPAASPAGRRFCAVGAVMHNSWQAQINPTLSVAAQSVALEALNGYAIDDDQQAFVEVCMDVALGALNDCAKDISYDGVLALNDDGAPADCHPNVLACFDAAIARLEGELAAAGAAT